MEPFVFWNSYTVQVKPLIWCESIIEHYSGRVEFMVKAKAQFKRRSTANNVEILIPVPEDADSPKFKSTIGSVSYAPEKNMIIWKIKQFPGGKEFVMRAHFGLPSVKSGTVYMNYCPFSFLNSYF